MKLNTVVELGANLIDANSVAFKVWAPNHKSVEVKVIKNKKNNAIPMDYIGGGYFEQTCAGIKAGDRYVYVLDGKIQRADPVSRLLPEGVHGPSEVVDSKSHRWKDHRWKGLSMREFIIYELHIGLFTAKGTFDSAIEKLPYLKQLGVTCIEIMPVSQFPGKRNWGYDGVSLYAVQNSYGGPEGLKRLVDACHQQKIAVCLDVVYNHFGPEGNYLSEFGPYFTDKYKTPWGQAVNFDDRDCDPVRRFIIENALYWVNEYHIDALRLDAVHAIYDFGAKHILEELNDCVQAKALELDRKVSIIAESDLNDTRFLRDKKVGGYGLQAQWSDDFHHALHVMLSGEKRGYYSDFVSLGDFAEALKQAFVYNGKYSSFRGRRHGNSTKGLAGDQFVICTQNHDQIGNRALGDRLSTNISFGAQKLAAIALLLTPYTPLLFMGQEYGEVNPFPYFIDHSDADLVEAVRQGRKKEFKDFGLDVAVDPKDEAVYLSAKLNWKYQNQNQSSQLLHLYRTLIQLRKNMITQKKSNVGKLRVQFSQKEQWVELSYQIDRKPVWGVFMSFSSESRKVSQLSEINSYREILHTENKEFGGQRQKPKRGEARQPIVDYIGALVYSNRA